MLNIILALILGAPPASVHAAANKPEPLPVPARVRVASTAPLSGIWSRLTLNERRFAAHVIAAARAGKDILYFQNHRHGLLIRKVLEQSLADRNFKKTRDLLGPRAFDEYLNYAAKFEDQFGPYAPSNQKYVLRKVSAAQAARLFETYAADSPDQDRREAVALLTDPAYEVLQIPETEDGAGLESCGGNSYDPGITGAQVEQAVKAGLDVCLFCRVSRGADGKLQAQPLTVSTPGVAGPALRAVVAELRQALAYAQTPRQRAELEDLARFFEKGDLKDFRQANMEWVRDGTQSTVDVMLGFIEVYQDYRKKIGSWESYVQIVDPATTSQSAKLAHNAQYFEDLMPYGQFKKRFPADYAPPALMVYYFQEIASGRSSGYNLPNFDDIRRDVGAKNIIRLPLPGEDADPEMVRIRRELYREFLPPAMVKRALSMRAKAWRVLVLLHEIIGHGSGTYDESKYGREKDPISELGNLGSALEEQRADLTALAFAGDSKLVDVGIYKNPAEALATRNALYDEYLVDFLRHVSKERSLIEDHQRGNWLFIHMLLENGAAAWAAKDGKSRPAPGNQVLIVRDYDKVRATAVDLLSELQRIKAVRDEEAMHKLFADHAPLEAIQEPWAQAVIARGETLAINAGSVEQPWQVTPDARFRLLAPKPALDKVAQVWADW